MRIIIIYIYYYYSLYFSRGGKQCYQLAQAIDLSLNFALKRKQAYQSVASVSSDSLTTTRLSSIETSAVFSDFRHFQVGSVDFRLIVVKHFVWGTFRSDADYLARFEEDLFSLLFQNQTQ